MLDKIEADGSAQLEAQDTFLLDYGFDLLSAFRSIKSEVLRKSIIALIAASAQAEKDASQPG